MKKILTLVTPDEADTADTAAPDGVELIGTDNGKNLCESVKKAKGRYTALTDCDTECELSNEVFTALNEASADIIAFDGSYCFKTSVLKGVPAKNCADKFSAEVYAAFSSKSVEKLDFKPFLFFEHAATYSETDEAALIEILDEFGKVKAKLSKEVYAFAFELIADRLINYYSSALIAVHSGTLTAERLAQFDGKLKENIVLYLAIEKRLANAGINIKKIREKNYKISFITANKLKKQASKKGRG